MSLLKNAIKDPRIDCAVGVCKKVVSHLSQDIDVLEAINKFALLFSSQMHFQERNTWVSFLKPTLHLFTNSSLLGEWQTFLKALNIR